MTDEPLHKLGAVLRTAREAKGVDLARVERETKIRTRYLAALEEGDYRDLPGAVYTKGFLRNYGTYLELDPEYLVDLFRIETASTAVERPSLVPPPRPIARRRGRALVVTPGAIAAAILTVLVALFVVYVGAELVIFGRTPRLLISDPTGNLSGWQASEYTIRGSTEPNARVTVDGLRENPSTTADANGTFSILVKLAPGANVINLSAFDPVTKRDAPTQTVTIVVAAGASPSPGVAIALRSPADGATLNGPVPLAGGAGAGATIRVAAKLVSAAPSSFTILNLANQPVPLKLPVATPPAPTVLTTAADGTFAGSMSLPPGTWELTLSGAPATASLTRRVTVAPPAGLVGSVEVSSAASYLEVDQDGTPMAGTSGRVLAPGTRVDLTATRTLRLRAGNAAAVILTLNGVRIGPIGASGAVVEWEITRNG